MLSRRFVILSGIIILGLILMMHVIQSGSEIEDALLDTDRNENGEGTRNIAGTADKSGNIEIMPNISGCDIRGVVMKQRQCASAMDAAHATSVTCSVLTRAIVCMREIMGLCHLSRQSLAHAARMLRFQVPHVCKEHGCHANVSAAIDGIVSCKETSSTKANKCERVLSLKSCLIQVRQVHWCHTVLQDVILDEVPDLKDTEPCQ